MKRKRKMKMKMKMTTIWSNNLTDDLDEIIVKSKSFEDQTESIRKVYHLNEYRFINNYGNKELKCKIFTLELAHFSNNIGKKIFKQIFGHRFETLANQLINTTNKEENEIIVNNINENKEKLYKEDETSPCYDYVIQPSNQRNDLIDAINVILNYNKTIQLDLTWKYKNERIKKWTSDFNWWKQSKLLSTSCHHFVCVCVCMKWSILPKKHLKAMA